MASAEERAQGFYLNPFGTVIDFTNFGTIVNNDRALQHWYPQEVVHQMTSELEQSRRAHPVLTMFLSNFLCWLNAALDARREARQVPVALMRGGNGALLSLEVSLAHAKAAQAGQSFDMQSCVDHFSSRVSNPLVETLNRFVSRRVLTPEQRRRRQRERNNTRPTCSHCTCRRGFTVFGHTVDRCRFVDNSRQVSHVTKDDHNVRLESRIDFLHKGQQDLSKQLSILLRLNGKRERTSGRAPCATAAAVGSALPVPSSSSPSVLPISAPLPRSRQLQPQSLQAQPQPVKADISDHPEKAKPDLLAPPPPRPDDTPQRTSTPPAASMLPSSKVADVASPQPVAPTSQQPQQHCNEAMPSSSQPPSRQNTTPTSTPANAFFFFCFVYPRRDACVTTPYIEYIRRECHPVKKFLSDA